MPEVGDGFPVEGSGLRKRGASRSRARYALSRKYSIFSGLLIFYLVLVFLLYDLWSHNFQPLKTTALAISALLAAGAIAKFTNRLIGRPLGYLQEGMEAVSGGRLDAIQVSRTGDEIEFLGESFNAMIRALARSQEEVRQYQLSLEDRIRQRTADLEAATTRALAASQAKSEFLANMSHELRTPMSGVLGMLDIVIDGNLDSDQREQLLTAKSCANTLLALLNDILDLSKIEAGKMTLEEVPFDPRAITRECADAARAKANSQRLALRCRIAPGVPDLIAGDPLRFRQIVTNLLSNAVKFTEAGFVEIALGMEGTNGCSRLLVEVVDTGIGIPADKLSTVFEEFTQADGSISRKYGGTGLGLAITRRLVNMLGGEISVQSEVGRGSVFRILLPARPVCELAGFHEIRTASSGPSPAETDSSQRTILVAEDNPVNQKVVTAMLKRHGYRVELAHHGGEVLEVLERCPPVSVILMDIQMPVVDGVEATRLIRADPRWRRIPVIAMTAHAMSGDREAYLKQGMDDYVSKPLTRQQLIPIVEKYLAEGAAQPSPGLVSAPAGLLCPE